MKLFNKNNINTSKIYVASIILIVIGAIITLELRIYNAHYRKILDKLITEAERIEQSFNNIVDHTAYLMKMMITQIIPNHDDKNYINNILNKYRTSPNISNVLSWTIFSWVDKDHQLIIDSVYGVLDKPTSLANREYIKHTITKPGKIILGQSVIGSTSRRNMIPAGIGAQDRDGQYIGAMTIGFDVDNLAQRLQDEIRSEGVQFVLMNENFVTVLKSNNFNDYNQNINKYIEKIKQAVRDQKHVNILKLLRNSEYYLHKMTKYPYIICIYYDQQKIDEILWENVISRSIEIALVLTAAALLLLIIKRRETSLRRKAEIARGVAIESSKEKSDFLAYIAHELRSSLSFIVTGSEVLKNQLFGELSKRYVSYIQNIHSSSLDMLKFIDELLDEMSIEARNIKIQAKPTDIKEVFDKTIKVNANKAQKYNIIVSVEVQENLPLLITDQRRLVQVFDNLLNNSIKYSPHNTSIKLTAKLTNNSLEVAIIDQGFGIADHQIEQAFSNYGVIANENSNKVKSIGLGLAIVKMLVEALQAEIKVEKNIEHGTTIKIIFPKDNLLMD